MNCQGRRRARCSPAPGRCSRARESGTCPRHRRPSPRAPPPPRASSSSCPCSSARAAAPRRRPSHRRGGARPATRRPGSGHGRPGGRARRRRMGRGGGEIRAGTGKRRGDRGRVVASAGRLLSFPAPHQYHPCIRCGAGGIASCRGQVKGEAERRGAWREATQQPCSAPEDHWIGWVGGRRRGARCWLSLAAGLGAGAGCGCNGHHLFFRHIQAVDGGPRAPMRP